MLGFKNLRFKMLFCNYASFYSEFDR